MDMKRIVLYVLAAILAVSLYNAWQHSQQVNTPAAQTQTQQQAGYVPPAFNPAANENTTARATVQPTDQLTTVNTGKVITVTTDTLRIKIASRGGNVVSAELLKYPNSLKDKSPVQLFSAQADRLYVGQSSLTNIAVGNQTNAQAAIQYAAPQASYTLEKGQKDLAVTLTGRSENGLLVNKTYTFTPNSYQIHLRYDITNKSSKTWVGSMYLQLKRRDVEASAGFLHPHSYLGAAYSTADRPYHKLSFSDMSSQNLSQVSKGGWVAMQQHYFLSAWVPNQHDVYHYYSHVDTPATGKPVYNIGVVAPQLTIAPGKQEVTGATLYVGPEIARNLSGLANGLDLTIDYGWLAPISQLIFWLMFHIEAILGNWGLAIILVTIFIKALFYKLSEKSYMSMAKMRDLAPRIQAIKERCGDDKQKLSQATMELYKKEKVNPLGGCLPMLIQIPVFIALYYVLYESVELRQAPFMFWIQDLSAPDPYFVLPILMGLSMLLQQKLSPAPPDPAQAKMMMILPVVFTIFFLSFPAGLVLYWLVNNITSVAQQYYVMQKYKKHGDKSKKTKKKK